MTHDYLSALDEMPESGDDGRQLILYFIEHRAAIKHALLVADRLMQPPNAAVMNHFSGTDFNQLNPGKQLAELKAFKAMRDQMLAELTPAPGGEV
jgi:hypothetical protein